MQRGQAENSQWTQDLHQESINGGGTAGDDDFTKFLELGNDFTHFEDVDQSNTTPTGLDTPMGRLSFAQNGQLHTLTPGQQVALQDMDMSMGTMQAHTPYSHIQQSQQYHQYALYQQMQNLYQHQVPPTPVSGEMQGAKYGHAIDASGQIIFDRQTASFTPLVSPAQTPLDNAWGVPDYVVADDFFSPLTSPAIEAQHNYTSTNTTSSPIDFSVDQTLSSHSNENNKKPRRKLNPTSRVTSSRNLKSTPGKSTNRRRQVSVGSLSREKPTSATNEVTESQYLQPSSTNVISSEDSVSPEPLSEKSMRPPPLPQSRTPYTLQPNSKEDNAPVTPSTLMRIPGKQGGFASNDNFGVMESEVMEDISLPAAASEVTSRSLQSIVTRVSQDDGQKTPTLSVKTPKLSATSTPHSVAMKPSNEDQDDLSKASSRGGRQSKKRQSTTQATISPAIRPKISPSISPLVPNTGPGMPVLSAETSALYLASKSNYQNIIDGTHLPGVSYPETLAENLSSKRTSHKLAEQGRRNRINLALKEIEALLPASITAAAPRKDKTVTKEEADANEKAAAAQGASKASTVEMAIVYIRSLQAELKETKDKLEAAEKSLVEPKSSGSQSSDQ